MIDRRATLVLLGALALAGCERRVELYEPTCVIAPGDTVHAVAVLSRGASIFYGLEYESVNSPREFRWSSADTGVFTVTPEGLVVGRRAGIADVRASSDGLTGVRPVSVAPAAATVRAVPARTVLDRDDTIAVRFEGVDSIAPFGRNPGLHALFSRSVTVFAEGDPGVPKIAAVAPGTALVTWCAAGRSGLLRIVVRPRQAIPK